MVTVPVAKSSSSAVGSTMSIVLLKEENPEVGGMFVYKLLDLLVQNNQIGKGSSKMNLARVI